MCSKFGWLESISFRCWVVLLGRLSTLQILIQSVTVLGFMPGIPIGKEWKEVKPICCVLHLPQHMIPPQMGFDTTNVVEMSMLPVSDHHRPGLPSITPESLANLGGFELEGNRPFNHSSPKVLVGRPAALMGLKSSGDGLPNLPLIAHLTLCPTDITNHS